MLTDLLNHDTYDAVPSVFGIVVALVGEAVQSPNITWAGAAIVLGVQFLRVSPRLVAVLVGGRRKDARLQILLAENTGLRRDLAALALIHAPEPTAPRAHADDGLPCWCEPVRESYADAPAPTES